ncbi:MAG: hypothetical protein HY898_35015 [Deltaproteobacteria bacterium]|nr:hypothetical protein [Deltaproteobacteria bacterium]
MAGGFIFPAAQISAPEARRRILACWTPGAAVYRTALGPLLRLRDAVRVRCDRAPGLVLVRSGAGLSAGPAPEKPPLLEGEVLVPASGRWCIERCTDACLETPEQWLELASSRLAEVASLGEAAPQTIASPPPPAEVRALLSIPPASVDRASVLAALRAPRRTAQAGAAVSRALAVLGRAAQGFVRGLFAAWLGPGRTTGAVRPPAPEGLPSPLWLAVKSLLSRLWMRGALGWLVGRKHAAYLMRTMRLLRQGDLDRALREAIPLSALWAREPLPPAWRLGASRSELRPSMSRIVATSSVGVGPSLHAELSALYRSAKERLEGQGRVEEAAFVLADLLDTPAEAIALLERHRRFRFAAELAEARLAHDPVLAIRLWMLARDRAAAIRVARQHRAFAAAIARLERGHAEEAVQLRLLWGDLLASAGRFDEAVEAVWPVATARPLALRWIECAVAAGEALAPRMLARWAVESDSPWEQVRDRVLCATGGQTRDDARRRFELADALARHKSPRALALLGTLLRPVLRDRVELATSVDRGELARLCSAAGDAALRSDLGRFPVFPARPELDAAAPVEHTLKHRGAQIAADVVRLPSGRLLAALGQAGVQLLARDGRVLHLFDQPATRLVLADAGDRALGIHPLGDGTSRISRLDLAGRRAEPWLELRLSAFASTFDGESWLVSQGRTVQALDVLAPEAHSTWTVDGEGTALAVERDRCAVAILWSTVGGMQRWSYDRTMTLRSRKTMPALGEDLDGSGPPFSRVAALAVTATAVALALDRGDVAAFVSIWDGDSHGTLELAGRCEFLALSHGAIATANRDQHGALTLELRATRASSDRKTGAAVLAVTAVQARLRVDSAALTAVRFNAHELLTADSAGRIASLDVRTGELEWFVL